MQDPYSLDRYCGSTDQARPNSNRSPARRTRLQSAYERRSPRRSPAVVLIDAIPETYRKAPRKQRSTTRRICDDVRFRDVLQQSGRCGKVSGVATRWTSRSERHSFRRATTEASRRRSSTYDHLIPKTLIANYIFASVAGIIWYFRFFSTPWASPK